MKTEEEFSKFLTEEEFEKIKKFSENKKTPFLLINLNKVEKEYDALKENIPYAKIYYAVKANPNNEVIKLLFEKGSNFDIATIYELNQLLDLNIPAERMSYGNTIKKEEDIAYAFEKGVRLFATDSDGDLNKIARKAPGSRVFFRLLCDGSGADWPLSRKFGTYPDKIFKLALKAKELKLIPYGLSFHVGSQQREIGQWDNAISQCKYLFTSLKEAGITLNMINLGGGLPSNYLQPVKELNIYAKEITRFLKEDFGENIPEILIEPGRSIVGNTGTIVSEIIMISQKSQENTYKWLYLDIGKFGGLIETIDEAIKYPIITDKKEPAKDLMEFIIAGPTCDSMDILYENYKYSLNKELKEKDKIYILTAGAYTASYSSVCFNGIPPLKVYTEKF